MKENYSKCPGCGRKIATNYEGRCSNCETIQPSPEERKKIQKQNSLKGFLVGFFALLFLLYFFGHYRLDKTIKELIPKQQNKEVVNER